MHRFRYIENAATLALDADRCIGCGLCATVCPHRILTVMDGKAAILDPGACMECGACARNCPTGALSVTPGTGCAAYLIALWLARLTGKSPGTNCC